MDNKWKLPDLRQGDQILWRADPNANEGVTGYISQVKATSCDVVLIGSGGLGARHNALHVTDPRIAQAGPNFAELHGDRGVFDLTAAEKERRDLVTKMPALEKFVEKLSRDVEALRSQVSKRG